MTPAESWGPMIVVYVLVYGFWSLAAFTVPDKSNRAEVKSGFGALGLVILIASWKLGVPPGFAGTAAALAFAAPWLFGFYQKTLEKR